MPIRKQRWMAAIALVGTLFTSQAAAAPPAKGPAKGQFLIAERKLLDPNFAQTVVLLVSYNEKGALGIIINRPTPVKMSNLLPELEPMKGRAETAYLGGPVQQGTLMVLIRTKQDLKTEEAQRVCDGVWVSASVDVLEQLASGEAPAEEFRGYAGYAGWGAGQLDNEIARGDWRILPADEATVFTKAPHQIWKQLIQRTEVRFAGLTPAATQPTRAWDWAAR